MSVSTDPIPPVPTHTKFLKGTKGSKNPEEDKVDVPYSNWFNLIREKVNVISASLVSLGVTGILKAIYGGTGYAAYTIGDILYADSTTTLAKLPIGSSTEVLTVISGLPAWDASAGGSGTAGGYTDATFANVSALLHFNGTNGSTTFTDVIGTTWTATGATISTVESVFGGASGLFSGAANQRIVATTNSGFDVTTNDWTIEFRAYPNGTHGNSARLFQSKMGDVFGGIDISEILGTGSNTFRLRLSSTGASFNILDAATSNFSLFAGQWNSILIQRRNNSIQIMVNEVLVAATYIIAGSLYYNAADSICIGGQSGTSRTFNGYIDEFRFTKGEALCRNILLPTSAFADS